MSSSMTQLIKTASRLSRANPIRALYRILYPIPRSPAPKNFTEAHALQLVPPRELTKKFVSVLKFLKQHSKSPIGDYVEFGVYNGTSMRCMFNALTQLNLHNPRLVGFDSFQGLPAEVAEDDAGVWRPGQFACPKDVAVTNLLREGVPPARMQLVEGWYKDTLQPGENSLANKSVSVVMFDCDAYSSAKLALDYISPYLKDVCAVFFDDWRLNDLDLKGLGEYRAFDEFLRSRREFIATSFGRYNRKSKVFIVRRVSAGSAGSGMLKRFLANLLRRL